MTKIRRFKYFHIFLILLCYTNLVKAQNDTFNYITVKALEDQWETYPSNFDFPVPFLPSIQNNIYSVYNDIDLKPYESLYLYIECPNKTSLFVNNHLTNYLSDNKRLLLNIDSLLQNNNSQFRFTLFNESPFVKIPEIGIIRLEKISIIDKTSEESTFSPLVKGKAYVSNSLLIFSLFVLASFAIYSKQTNNSLSISTIIQPFSSVGVVRRRVSQETSLQSVIGLISVYVITLSFTLVLLELSNTPFLEGSIDANYSNKTLHVILSIIIFVTCKILLMRVLSMIYRIGGLFETHLLEFMKIAQIYSFLLFIICILYNLRSSSLGQELLVYFFVFSLTLKSLIISFKVNKHAKLTNMYLVSYFCTTEFVPLLIAFKYFSNN